MHVYVADMVDFARVNEAYGKFFGLNPPPRYGVMASLSILRLTPHFRTRVTVEIHLSSPTRIQIDCMAFKSADKIWDKETMHVQSVSYWA